MSGTEDEFDIFDELLTSDDDCRESRSSVDTRKSYKKVTADSDPDEGSCRHSHTEDGICVDCGQEITGSGISFDKEWKAKTNDGRRSQRCVQRRQDSKDIMKDLENLDVPIDIKMKANDLFVTATEGKIYRGEKRRGMMYTSVFDAYDYFPESAHQKNVTYLQNFFGLNRSAISRANILYQTAMHKKSGTRTKTYVTPKNYFRNLVTNIGGTDKEISEIERLYDLIGKRSRTLSIARPESYAAALVCYYCQQHKKYTDVAKFVKDSDAKLSPNTVEKNMKEIDRILAKIVQETEEQIHADQLATD